MAPNITVSSLPDDIWLLIIEQIPRKADLFCLCQASRRFYKLTVPFLYRSVSISFLWGRRSRAFDFQISKHDESVNISEDAKRNLRFTKDLFLDLRMPSNLKDVTKSKLIRHIQTLLSSFDFEKIHTLRWRCFEYLGQEMFSPTGIAILSNDGGSTVSKIPALRELKYEMIGNLSKFGKGSEPDFTWCRNLESLSWDLGPETALHFESILKTNMGTLRKIVIRGNNHPYRAEIPSRSIWGDLITGHTGTSRFSALEELSISCVRFSELESYVVSFFNMPSLRKVKISNCVPTIPLLNCINNALEKDNLHLESFHVARFLRSENEKLKLAEVVYQLLRKSRNLRVIEVPFCLLDLRSTATSRLLLKAALKQKKTLRTLVCQPPYAVEEESGGISFDERQVSSLKQLFNSTNLSHVSLALNVTSLHRTAWILPTLSEQSRLKTLILFLTGSEQLRTGGAWNANSVFDWPQGADWYIQSQGINGREEALGVCNVFNCSLALTTPDVPHDLQKVLHWMFGPSGFKCLNAAVLHWAGWLQEISEPRGTKVFCRNDLAPPWEIINSRGDVDELRVPSCFPNFRSIWANDYIKRENLETALEDLLSFDRENGSLSGIYRIATENEPYL